MADERTGPVSGDHDPSSTREVDRRAYRRAAIDRPVLIETASRTITARGVDVSGGGLSLGTDHDLEIGERVSLYFELPIGVGVQTDGVVTRIEGKRAALRFVDCPREALLAVRSFCRVSGLMPVVGQLRAR